MKIVRNFFIKMTAKVRWLILAYIASRLLAAFLYQFVEGWSFLDGWWWGEVASLTIGYGDVAPATFLGRMLATCFHFFWVYYIGLALGAHIVMYLIRDSNILTHKEQEWMFHTITIVFDWVRWIVQALVSLAASQGVKLTNPPHRNDDGKLVECLEQAPDTDYENQETAQR